MNSVAVATTWAEQVKSGKLPAGKYTRLAATRYLRDLRRRGLGFKLDGSRSDRACDFIALLPHVSGRWAAHRKTVVLEPWQTFIVVNLFGWVDADGNRRFREAYLEIARKNGKSTLACCIALYCFAADGEYGAEVYSGASTEKQAWQTFRPAKLMCERTDELRAQFGIEVNAKTIVIPETGARFETIIGNPGDGQSPSCVVIDEYHEHANADLYDTMTTGTAAREQPLVLIITTAGANFAGPCYERRQTICKMLDGSLEEPHTFAVLFGADEKDAWNSVVALEKANPNLGVSVSRRFLIDEARRCEHSPSKRAAYETKHLNRWVGARLQWLNVLRWQRCKRKDLAIEKYLGRPCYLGLDLATKRDVVSLAITFEDGDRLALFARHFLPEAALTESPNASMYRQWNEAGWLTLTPDDTTDFGFIENAVKQLGIDHEVISVAIDPYQAAYLGTRLADHGIEVVEFGQTVKNMSDPAKSFEVLINTGKLLHPGDPVMGWMVGNVVVRRDEKDNIYPCKPMKGGPAKIDGVIASIMAVARWEAETSIVESPWENPDYEIPLL